MSRLFRKFIGSNWSYRIVTLLAVAFSTYGIIAAAKSGVLADGGRGGAVGCALTFLLFFLGHPTAERALEFASRTNDPLQTPPPSDLDTALTQIEGLKSQTASVRGAVAVMIDVAAREKVYLSFASVFSTIVWGFGDVIAAKLAPLVQ